MKWRQILRNFNLHPLYSCTVVHRSSTGSGMSHSSQFGTSPHLHRCCPFLRVLPLAYSVLHLANRWSCSSGATGHSCPVNGYQKRQTEQRRRRPDPEPVNCMIAWTYTSSFFNGSYWPRLSWIRVDISLICKTLLCYNSRSIWNIQKLFKQFFLFLGKVRKMHRHWARVDHPYGHPQFKKKALQEKFYELVPIRWYCWVFLQY